MSIGGGAELCCRRIDEATALVVEGGRLFLVLVGRGARIRVRRVAGLLHARRHVHGVDALGEELLHGIEAGLEVAGNGIIGTRLCLLPVYSHDN